MILETYNPFRTVEQKNYAIKIANTYIVYDLEDTWINNSLRNFILKNWLFEATSIVKNHTHVKIVGHTSEFPVGIYWWTSKNPKIQNIEKMTKKWLFIAGDIIILCMCTSDIEWYKSFLSFWPFFALYPPPLTTQKTKKIPKDIILLHMCNINQDHMMYSSWNIKCKGQSFFVIFYPLTLLTTQKNQNSEKVKKKKKKQKILSFYTCVPQMTIIGCMVPEITSRTESFVILGYFLPFYPLTIQKIKSPGDIIILNVSIINQNHIMYDPWDMECNRHNFSYSGPFFALLHLPLP